MENNQKPYAEITIRVEIKGLDKHIDGLLGKILNGNYPNITIVEDDSVLLTRNQIRKQYHVGYKTLNSYITAGLHVLPSGKISLFDYNNFIGKHKDKTAKNPL
jgi:hypothetical protein